MPAPDTVIPFYAAAALLIAFSVKHFFADFVLQTGALARGKEGVQGWVLPLTLHAGCHAALTLMIALVVAPRLWEIALVDFGVHFVIDRGKTLAGRQGCWNLQDNQFWWLFGLDQLLHQATNVALAMALLAA